MSLIASEDTSVPCAPILVDVGYQTLLSSDSPIPHDVVFEVDGQRVYGHSQILALSSTYIRTFLYGQLPPAETHSGMTVIREEYFSLAAIQNMMSFIYSSLDHSKFTHFDSQLEVTDQDEIKVVLETYRAADFYHIPGLVALCGEAVGRIQVTRTNFAWLESFLRPGILEERLRENVELVKKYVEELDKRSSGEKSQLDQQLKDKCDEWIEHELSCNDCTEVELTGAGFYHDGIYRKKGLLNGRPTYTMDIGWDIGLEYVKGYLLYYTGSHWLLVNMKYGEEYDDFFFEYDDLYQNLNENKYIVKFEDTSYHNGPPVYSTSVDGISLKCGARPICQKVSVTGRADLEGNYIAQNIYGSGVKIFEHEDGYSSIWSTSRGFGIEHAAYSDEDYDGPKKMCPCQATNWRYVGNTVNERLQVTCSSDNCLCYYHT